MFSSFIPDWQKHWTAEQAEKELSYTKKYTFKFKGPGIYDHFGSTIIVVPRDREPNGTPYQTEMFWKAEFHSEEVFTFCCYIDRNPSKMFNLLINAPTKK